MKDNEIALIVNQLRDIAVTFHNTQQLRERIAHVIVPLLKDVVNTKQTVINSLYPVGDD